MATTSKLIERIDAFDTEGFATLPDLFDDIKEHLIQQDEDANELRDEVRGLKSTNDDLEDERDRLERVADLAGPLKDAIQGGCASGIEETLEVAYRYACDKFGPGSDEADAFEQLLKVR